MTAFELKLWRIGQGWTQSQAAMMMGVGERTWRRYEAKGPSGILTQAVICMEIKRMLPELHMLSHEQALKRLSLYLAQTPDIKKNDYSNIIELIPETI